ncbi:hypothetical protein AX14_009858, partial [Amanita brunnescens Koide BX004]
TASALPNGCLPISSTQATPSRQAKNELKRPLPMVSGQHKPIDVIRPIPTVRNDAHLPTELGVQSALNGKVDRPGVNLPFHSKFWPIANMPPVRTEVPSTM